MYETKRYYLVGVSWKEWVTIDIVDYIFKMNEMIGVLVM